MNMKSKGITPVVAITLMIVITVGAAGTLYTIIQETQNNAEQSAPEIDLNSDNLNVESCWTEGAGPYNTSVSIRNDASESINSSRLDVIVEGEELDYYTDPDGLVSPQETFHITFTNLSSEDEISDGSEITMFMGSNSMSYNCWH